MPAVMPVTLPDPSSKIFPLVVLHVPPAVKLLKDIVEPIHTDVVPVIAAGNGLTVI